MNNNPYSMWGLRVVIGRQKWKGGEHLYRLRETENHLCAHCFVFMHKFMMLSMNGHDIMNGLMRFSYNIVHKPKKPQSWRDIDKGE